MIEAQSKAAALPHKGDRLALGRTLAEAYGIVGRNLPAFALLSVLMTVLTLGPAFLAERLLDGDMTELRSMVAGSASVFGGLGLAELAGILIGVVWFRVLLLHEPHRLRSYLQFGRRELRYLGVDLLLLFLTFAPIVALAVVATIASLGSGFDAAWLAESMTPLTIGAMLWAAVCMALLGLAYPAIATDGCAGGSLRHSLRLSRGHRVSLFLAFLLGSGIWDIGSVALAVIGPETEFLEPIDFFSTLLSSLGAMCFIAVGAVAYRQLQGRSLADLAGAFD